MANGNGEHPHQRGQSRSAPTLWKGSRPALFQLSAQRSCSVRPAQEEFATSGGARFAACALKSESEDSWIVDNRLDDRMERLMADHREWLHQHDLAIIRARRQDVAMRKRTGDPVSSIGALIREMRAGMREPY